jgi:hypothetical protein
VRVMLTLTEREEISRGLAEGLLYKEIGVLVGRDPSIVSREVAGTAAGPAIGRWARTLPLPCRGYGRSCSRSSARSGYGRW